MKQQLTIGYKGSLTEIDPNYRKMYRRVDKNKTHAQFTNLVAEPSAIGGDC